MFEYADPIDIMDLVLMSIASFVLFIKEDRENLYGKATLSLRLWHS